MVVVALVAIALFMSNIPQAAYANHEAIVGNYRSRVWTLADDLNSHFEQLGIEPAELYALENYTSHRMDEWHVDLVKVILIREWVWDPITPTTYYVDAGGHRHGVRRGHWEVTHNLTRPQAYIDSDQWVHWCPDCGPNANPTREQQSTMDAFEANMQSLTQPKPLITESVRHLKLRLRQEYWARQDQVVTLAKHPHLDGAGRRLLDQLDTLARNPYDLESLRGTRLTPTEKLARSLTLYLNDHCDPGIVHRYRVRPTGPGTFSISGWKHSGMATTDTVILQDGRRISWADLFDEVCETSGVSLPSPDLRLAVVVGDDPDRNQLADAIDETIAAGRLYVMATRYDHTSYTLLFHHHLNGGPEIWEYHALWVCSQEDRVGWELTRYERDVLAAWLKEGGTLIIGGLDSNDPSKRQETWLPTEAYSQFYPINLDPSFLVTSSQGVASAGPSRDAGYVGEGWLVEFSGGTVDLDMQHTHGAVHLPFYPEVSFYYNAKLASESYLRFEVEFEYWWEDPDHADIHGMNGYVNIGEAFQKPGDGSWSRFQGNALEWAQNYYGTTPDYIREVHINVHGEAAPGDTIDFDEFAMVTPRDYNLEPYLDMDVHDGHGYGDSCEVYTWESLMSGDDDTVGWTTRSLNGSTIFHVWAALPASVGAPSGPYPSTSEWFEIARGPTWIQYMNSTMPRQKRTVSGLDLTNLGSVNEPIWVIPKEFSSQFIVELTNHTLLSFMDASEVNRFVSKFPFLVWGVGVQTHSATSGFALDPNTKYALGQLLYGARLPDRTLPTLGEATYHVLPHYHALLSELSAHGWQHLSLAELVQSLKVSGDIRTSITAERNLEEGWIEVGYALPHVVIKKTDWSFALRIRVYDEHSEPHFKLDVTCHSHELQNFALTYDITATGWKTGYDLTEIGYQTEVTAVEQMLPVNVLKDITKITPNIVEKLRLASGAERGFFFDFADMRVCGFFHPRLRIIDVQLPWETEARRVVQVGMTDYGILPKDTLLTIDPIFSGYCEDDDVYVTRDQSGTYGDGDSSADPMKLGLTSGGGADWWAGNWGYRKSHTITAAASEGILTDYQVQLTIHRSSGADAGADVYLGTHCESDYQDLRFTTDGSSPTLLSYWIEEADEQSAVVWVKLPTISTAGTSFYIYYGNPSASSASSISDTFIFGDDFDSLPSASGLWDEVEELGTSGVGGEHSQSIVSGGNGGAGSMWRVWIYAWDQGSTHGWRCWTDAFGGLQNFEFRMRGEWDITDYHRAYGNWAAMWYDEDGGGNWETDWGYHHAFRGDNKITVWRQIDGSGYDPNAPDYTPGTVLSVLRRDEDGSSDYYSMSVSGTHSYSYSGTSSSLGIGGDLCIGNYHNEATSGTNPRGYYFHDWVFVRNFVDPEPTHGGWGGEEAGGQMQAHRILTRFDISSIPTSPVQQIDSATLIYPIASESAAHSHTVYVRRSTNPNFVGSGVDLAAQFNWEYWGPEGVLSASVGGLGLICDVTAHVQGAYDEQMDYAVWRMWFENDLTYDLEDWYEVLSNYGPDVERSLVVIYSEKNFAPTVGETFISGLENDGGGAGFGLQGWDFRKSHAVLGNGEAVADYQVPIVVHQGSGSDSGADVYCNGHCQADFDDIRFTAEDGETLLSYWLETCSVGNQAVFWVQVPVIPASGSTTIYIYYGNNEATSLSSIGDTFIFGDDFDIDPTTGGVWLVSSGVGQTSSIVSGGNGGSGHRWKIDASSTSVWSGYKIHYQFPYTQNFMIEGYGEWSFADHHRGAGDFCSVAYREVPDGPFWGMRTYLRGDYYEGYYHYVDGDGVWHNPSNTMSGYERLQSGRHEVGGNDYYRMSMDGTYDYTTSGTDSGYQCGGLVWVAGGTDYWTSAVEVDVWYDWVFIRNFVNPEPTQGSWGDEESAGGSFDNCYAEHVYSLQTTVSDENGWIDIYSVIVDIDDLQFTASVSAQGWTLYYPNGSIGGSYSADGNELTLNWDDFMVPWGVSLDDVNIQVTATDWSSTEGNGVGPSVDLIRDAVLIEYGVTGDHHVNPEETVGVTGRLQYLTAGSVMNRPFTGRVELSVGSGWDTCDIDGYFSIVNSMPETVDLYSLYPVLDGRSFPGDGVNVIVDKLEIHLVLVSDIDLWADVGTSIDWTFECTYAYDGSVVPGWNLQWEEDPDGPGGGLVEYFVDGDLDGEISFSWSYEEVTEMLLRAMPVDCPDGITDAINFLDYGSKWTGISVSVQLISDTPYPIIDEYAEVLVSAQWLHGGDYGESMALLKDGQPISWHELSTAPSWLVTESVYGWFDFSAREPVNSHGITYLSSEPILTLAWSLDSDMDTYSDLREIWTVYTNPYCNDTDSDGLPDEWELKYIQQGQGFPGLYPGRFSGFEYGYAIGWQDGIVTTSDSYLGNYSWQGQTTSRIWEIPSFEVLSGQDFDFWVLSTSSCELMVSVRIGPAGNWVDYPTTINIHDGYWNHIELIFTDFNGLEIGDDVTGIQITGGFTDLLIDEISIDFDDWVQDPDDDGKPNFIEYTLGYSPIDSGSPDFFFVHTWSKNLPTEEQFSTSGQQVFIEVAVELSANALIQLRVGTWESDWVSSTSRIRYLLPSLTVSTVGISVQSYDGLNVSVQLRWLSIYQPDQVVPTLDWKKASAIQERQNPKALYIGNDWGYLLTDPYVLPTSQAGIYGIDVSSLIPADWMWRMGQHLSVGPGLGFLSELPSQISQPSHDTFHGISIDAYPRDYYRLSENIINEPNIRPSIDHQHFHYDFSYLAVDLRDGLDSYGMIGEYPKTFPCIFQTVPETFVFSDLLFEQTQDMRPSEGYHLWLEEYDTTQDIRVYWRAIPEGTGNYDGTLAFHNCEVLLHDTSHLEGDEAVSIQTSGASTIVTFSSTCVGDDVDGFNLTVTCLPFIQDKTWNETTIGQGAAGCEWTTGLAGGTGLALFYLYVEEPTSLTRIEAQISSYALLTQSLITTGWLNGKRLTHAPDSAPTNPAFILEESTPSPTNPAHDLHPGFNQFLLRIQCEAPDEAIINYCESTLSTTLSWRLEDIGLIYDSNPISVASIHEDPYVLYNEYISASFSFMDAGKVLLYGYLDSDTYCTSGSPLLYREGLAGISVDGTHCIDPGEISAGHAFAENTLRFLMERHDQLYYQALTSCGSLVNTGEVPKNENDPYDVWLSSEAEYLADQIMVAGLSSAWDTSVLAQIGVNFDNLILRWGYEMEDVSWSPWGVSGWEYNPNNPVFPTHNYYYYGIGWDYRYIDIEKGDPFHNYWKPYLSIGHQYWYNPPPHSPLGTIGGEYYRVYSDTHVERVAYNPRFIYPPDYDPLNPPLFNPENNTLTIPEFLTEMGEIWASNELAHGEVVEAGFKYIKDMLSFFDSLLYEPHVTQISIGVLTQLQKLLWDLIILNDTEAYAIDLPDDEGTLFDWFYHGPWHGFRSFVLSQKYTTSDVAIVQLGSEVLRQLAFLRGQACGVFDIDADTAWLVELDQEKIPTHWHTIEEAIEMGIAAPLDEQTELDLGMDPAERIVVDNEGNPIAPPNGYWYSDTECFNHEITNPKYRKNEDYWEAVYERIRIKPAVSKDQFILSDSQFAYTGEFIPVRLWISTEVGGYWQIDMTRTPNPTINTVAFGITYRQSVYCYATPARATLLPIGTSVVHNTGNPSHPLNQARLGWIGTEGSDRWDTHSRGFEAGHEYEHGRELLDPQTGESLGVIVHKVTGDVMAVKSKVSDRYVTCMYYNGIEWVNPGDIFGWQEDTQRIAGVKNEIGHPASDTHGRTTVVYERPTTQESIANAILSSVESFKRDVQITLHQLQDLETNSPDSVHEIECLRQTLRRAIRTYAGAMTTSINAFEFIDHRNGIEPGQKPNGDTRSLQYGIDGRSAAAAKSYMWAGADSLARLAEKIGDQGETHNAHAFANLVFQLEQQFVTGHSTVTLNGETYTFGSHIAHRAHAVEAIAQRIEAEIANAQGDLAKQAQTQQLTETLQEIRDMVTHSGEDMTWEKNRGLWGLRVGCSTDAEHPNGQKMIRVDLRDPASDTTTKWRELNPELGLYPDARDAYEVLQVILSALSSMQSEQYLQGYLSSRFHQRTDVEIEEVQMEVNQLRAMYNTIKSLMLTLISHPTVKHQASGMTLAALIKGSPAISKIIQTFSDVGNTVERFSIIKVIFKLTDEHCSKDTVELEIEGEMHTWPKGQWQDEYAKFEKRIAGTDITATKVQGRLNQWLARVFFGRHTEQGFPPVKVGGKPPIQHLMENTFNLGHIGTDGKQTKVGQAYSQIEELDMNGYFEVDFVTEKSTIHGTPVLAIREKANAKTEFKINTKISQGKGFELACGAEYQIVKLYEQHVITEHFESFVAAHTCKPDTIWKDVSLARNDVRIIRAVGVAAARAGLDDLETLDLYSAAIAIRHLQRSGQGSWQNRLLASCITKCLDMKSPGLSHEIRKAVTGVDGTTPDSDVVKKTKTLGKLGVLGISILSGLASYLGGIPIMKNVMQNQANLLHQGIGAFTGMGVGTFSGSISHVTNKNPLQNTFGFQLVWAPIGTAIGVSAAMDADAVLGIYDKHATCTDLEEFADEDLERWTVATILSFLTWFTDYLELPFGCAIDFGMEMVNCLIGGFQIGVGAIYSSAVEQVMQDHPSWVAQGHLDPNNIPSYVINFEGLGVFLRHVLCYPSYPEIHDPNIELRTHIHYPDFSETYPWPWASYSLAGIYKPNPYYTDEQEEQFLPVYEPNIGCRIYGLGLHCWDDGQPIAIIWDIAFQVQMWALGALISIYVGGFMAGFVGVVASMLANTIVQQVVTFVHSGMVSLILYCGIVNAFRAVRLYPDDQE